MKTIVIGLGNPILGDDGVGWKVAEEVMKRLPEDAPIDVICLSVGGISLMENMIDYEHAIIVDAFASDAPAGSLSILKLDQLPNYSALHTTSAHDTSLHSAMELGRLMGVQLPDDVMIVGIATRHVFDFSEDLSPPIARVVRSTATIVLDMLKEGILQVEAV